MDSTYTMLCNLQAEMVLNRKQKLIVLLGFYYYRQRVKRLARRFWVDPFYLKRPIVGTYHVVMNELRSNPVRFYQYMRMDVERFDFLKSRIAERFGQSPSLPHHPANFSVTNFTRSRCFQRGENLNSAID